MYQIGGCEVSAVAKKDPAKQVFGDTKEEALQSHLVHLWGQHAILIDTCNWVIVSHNIRNSSCLPPP